jgi:hypothetical protein
MPARIVSSFADRTKKPIKDVERLWDKAKELATKQGHTKDYAYITGILKRMLKLESSTFRDKILDEELNEYISTLNTN